MGSQDELHDLEESLNSLVQLINSSHVEEGMQGIRGKVQQLYDHHIDTEKTTTQLLNGKLKQSLHLIAFVFGSSTQNVQILTLFHILTMLRPYPVGGKSWTNASGSGEP